MRPTDLIKQSDKAITEWLMNLWKNEIDRKMTSKEFPSWLQDKARQMSRISKRVSEMDSFVEAKK